MFVNSLESRRWQARVLSSNEIVDYVASIKQLTLDEQKRQAGDLIEGIDLESYLDKILSRADFAVLNVEGMCCGFCAYYTYKPELRSAFITLFLVKPEVRRVGMARGILEVVASSALQGGFRYLKLRVRQDNVPAIRFYLSQGFLVTGRHASDIEMTLSLTTLATP